METAKRFETELDEDLFIQDAYRYPDDQIEYETRIDKFGFVGCERI